MREGEDKILGLEKRVSQERKKRGSLIFSFNEWRGDVYIEYCLTGEKKEKKKE